jgi:hypothetical protein
VPVDDVCHHVVCGGFLAIMFIDDEIRIRMYPGLVTRKSKVVELWMDWNKWLERRCGG